jgi:hypothetical protein
MALPSPERAIPELFAVIERLPESDLGTPGPLVHTLEAMRDRGYESELVNSVQRLPTRVSVSMVNAILNSPLSADRRTFYMNILRDVVHNPEAAEEAREQAEHYIQYQNDRIA